MITDEIFKNKKMNEVNPVKPSNFMAQIIRLDHNVKSKIYIYKPIKIITDKHEKTKKIILKM